MARKFNFTISADNNPALRAIRSVNRELYKINKPFRDMGSAMRAFSRESGLKNMVNAFKGTADAAADVATKIGSILTPLIAVTGFGSVAGVIEMATHWGGLARQIELTKFQTGISSDAIQSWIGGGKLFGVTTEQMTSTLVGFSTALQDAVYGRNPGLYNTLGVVGIKNLHDRLGQPDKVLEEFADKLQKYTPLTRHIAIGNAGLSAIEPMLMDGSEGFHKALGAQKKFGYNQTDDEVKRGKEFAFAMFEADTAVGGLSNKIGADLLPVLMPMVKQFSEWVVKNRELISQNVVEFARDLADTLKTINFKDILDGVKGLASAIKSVVNFLGGWKNAFIVLALVMGAPMIAAVVNMSIAIGGFATTLALLNPYVTVLVAALWGLYWVWGKVFDRTKQQPVGNSLAESLAGWKGRLGMAGAGAGGFGAGFGPVNAFAGAVGAGAGFGVPSAAALTPMQIPGGANLGIVNPDVNQTASLIGNAIPKNGAGSDGNVNVHVAFDNMPIGATSKVTSKGNVTPSVSIYHSAPLSSGINP